MLEVLRSFPKDHPGVKRGVDGALWNLGEEMTRHVAEKAHGQVMISYSWGQQGRMTQLGFQLKKLGFPIWLDVEQMEGSVLEKMAEAVEESSIIVIGLSSSYKDSQACRTEAEYAYRLKKEVIFVLAEDGYVAKGWLGAFLGSKLWYSPWTNASGFDAGVNDIIKLIERKSVPFPSSSSSAPAPKAPLVNTPSTGGLTQGAELLGMMKEMLQKMDGLSTKMSSLENRMADLETLLKVQGKEPKKNWFNKNKTGN